MPLKIFLSTAWRIALLGSLSATALAAAKAPAAPLPEEEIRVESLPPADGNRLYVTDVAFNHMVDGRIHVLDGKKLKYLGMISAGFGALTTLSPDRQSIYVVTTYQRHLYKPPREDVLEIHDATNLALKAEVSIPAKRAQALPYPSLLATSTDGKQLYIQNATPATSISVVDLDAHKFLGEIQTPGCWSIHPWQDAAGESHRLSALCGDGTLLTLAVDAGGEVRQRQRSTRFFDPDKDPLFIHAQRAGDRRYFISYGGDVYTLRLSGEGPSFEPSWSLLSEKERKQGWRPGGFQISALHQESGTLFVTMHDKAFDGSHKNPAREVWVYDIARHQRIARIPGDGAVSLAVSQGPDARLYQVDVEKGRIRVRAVKSGYPLVGELPAVGDTPVTVEVQ